MPKVKLTTAAVERLKPPATGQADYFDAAYPALALRVSAKGVRSWVYFGRIDGKLKRVTLGRYPYMTLSDARKEAGHATDAMRAGTDVTKAKREARKSPKDKDTVEAVTKEWMKRDQASNRSRNEVQRVLDHDVLPKWKDRHIQSIGRRDVIELIDGIVDRGAPIMARRIQTHLHRLFKWCAAREVIETNPIANLPKPGKVTARDRVLSDNELKEVWNACDQIGWPFGPAVRLLILTGARREEIGGLRWAEVDFDENEIGLDGDRTKNGKPHDIPLSEPARDLLDGLPKITNTDGQMVLAFTTNGKNPVSGWSKAKRLLDREIAKAREKAAAETNREPEIMPDWRIHDLRRTVATGLQRLGFRLEVIEAVLGHVGGTRAGIVGVYQRHEFKDEKRKALDAWSEHVITLIENKNPDNVIFGDHVQ